MVCAHVGILHTSKHCESTTLVSSPLQDIVVCMYVYVYLQVHVFVLASSYMCVCKFVCVFCKFMYEWMQEALKHVAQDDGIFWVSKEEFFHYFKVNRAV